jgi:hypothetical protein
MIAERNLTGHVQPDVCNCQNGGKPDADGFIHISVNCPVHRLTPLYERDAAKPLNRGRHVQKKGSSSHD